MKKISMLIIILLILLMYILNIPSVLGLEYRQMYYFLLICYFLYFLETVIVVKNIKDIFDPLFLVWLLYYLIFSIRPLNDIINGGIFSSSGKDISSGCYKGTLLFILGFIFLLLGYILKLKSEFFLIKNLNKKIKKNRKTLIIAISIWCVSLGMVMIYFLGNGFTLSYILTMGMNGEINVDEKPSLMIFSIFRSCLISSWLYIAIISKNKSLKIVTFFIGLMIMLSMGGRTAALIYIFIPIIYFYTSRMKLLSLKTVIVGVIFIISLCVVMEMTRTGIRTGQGFELKEITFEKIMSPFDHELTTYKIFYALVDSIPEKGSYSYGKGMIIYTLVLMIPRALWHGKPYPPIYDIIGISIDDTAVKGGAVYPNIGEYYAEFGIIGVFFFMFIFGRFLKFIKRLRMTSVGNTHSLILYSVLYMSILPLVTRGFTPGNFYQILAICFPIFIISKFT